LIKLGNHDLKDIFLIQSIHLRLLNIFIHLQYLHYTLFDTSVVLGQGFSDFHHLNIHS